MIKNNISGVEANQDDLSESSPEGLPASPATPNLQFLSSNFQQAIKSFYATIEQIVADNPVDVQSLQRLSVKALSGDISALESNQLEALKLSALAQGKAVGAVMGFFLKFNPYPMFAEIRAKEAFFQPVFGPILVVEHQAVLDTLSRHAEFTVDPYGAEMSKSMSAEFNGGYDTFILSTDNDDKYVGDKALLTSVVRRGDAAKIVDIIRMETKRRVHEAVKESRANESEQLDVVSTVARFIPVYLGDHYLGVPVESKRGKFDLTDDMLKYYGEKVVGPDGKTPLPTRITLPDGGIVELPDSALKRTDGVIPDEQTVYDWIVAAFKHFFNNVQKDIEVQARGVRAYRELLVYLLREIDIQRKRLKQNFDCAGKEETMLSRLIEIQLGLRTVGGVNLEQVSDLRIAENVMGTIVGAVAGQEEATCRVIDSMIKLRDREFEQTPSEAFADGLSSGSYEHAQALAVNILEGHEVEENQAKLDQYVLEALRLQPQGEVLLRVCVIEGATINNSRPIRAGTLIFAAHGSAMQDIDHAGAFICGRDSSSYLQFGHQRHTCLGQYVSPVLMREALIALLALDNLHRPTPESDQIAFPRERRFGRFQLDDDNLYAKTFTLAFDDSEATRRYYP